MKTQSKKKLTFLNIMKGCQNNWTAHPPPPQRTSPPAKQLLLRYCFATASLLLRKFPEYLTSSCPPLSLSSHIFYKIIHTSSTLVNVLLINIFSLPPTPPFYSLTHT